MNVAYYNIYDIPIYASGPEGMEIGDRVRTIPSNALARASDGVIKGYDVRYGGFYLVRVKRGREGIIEVPGSQLKLLSAQRGRRTRSRP